MATSLTDLIADVRSNMVESVARFFSDAEITRWINLGQKNFSAKVLWYSRVRGLAVVANQVEYDLPSDLLKIEMLRWQEQFRLRLLDESAWAQYTYIRSNQQSNTPFFALAYPFDKKLSIHPASSSASASTTLSAGINASVTTIPVVSTSGFPSKGRFLLDSEEIRYYAVDATNFLQCVRGFADTTAASHLIAATVTEGRLQIYYRTLPPDLAGSDTIKLPEAYSEALVHYATYRCFKKRNMNTEAQLAYKAYHDMREEAVAERQKADLDNTLGVHDEEFGMGYYGDI